MSLPTEETERGSRAVRAWEERGTYRELCGHRIFTLEAGPAREPSGEPLLVLHGFPTCSFDFHLVLDRLAQNRRVLLLDMLGYGLSAKPDLAYTIAKQADIVQAYVDEVLVTGSAGLHGQETVEPGGLPVRTSLAMLSHDMGDTVGGELLARQAEGDWEVQITRRVLTNGSIYIEMAHLTDGQQLLLALPDQCLPSSPDPTGASMISALAATFASGSVVPRVELEAAWQLIAHDDGALVLPRLIRYIEERRANQARFTGAIESHPSPLHILWGPEDPIAVREMASRIHWVRADSTLDFLSGVGHYPMIEAPDRFADAVETALGV